MIRFITFLAKVFLLHSINVYVDTILIFKLMYNSSKALDCCTFETLIIDHTLVNVKSDLSWTVFGNAVKNLFSVLKGVLMFPLNLFSICPRQWLSLVCIPLPILSWVMVYLTTTTIDNQVNYKKVSNRKLRQNKFQLSLGLHSAGFLCKMFDCAYIWESKRATPFVVRA